MISLIKADLYKETRKKSLKYVLFILILFIIIYLINITSNLTGTNKINYVNKLNKEEYHLINKNGSYNEYKNKYALYEKEISAQVEINSISKYTKTLETINYTGGIYYIVGLLIIFIAFHNLNYDYVKGTLKYIFISNKSKIKILLSKIISLTIISISLLIISLLISLIVSSIFNKENIFLITKIIYYNNKFITLPIIYYEIIKCLTYLMPLLFIIIFTLFLCIIFKGNNYGLIVSILIYLFGSTITSTMLTNGIKLVEYLPLPYLDFTYFSDTSYLINNIIYNVDISINKAIIIFIVYGILLTLTSIKLLKRDL